MTGREPSNSVSTDSVIDLVVQNSSIINFMRKNTAVQLEKIKQNSFYSEDIQSAFKDYIQLLEASIAATDPVASHEADDFCEQMHNVVSENDENTFEKTKKEKFLSRAKRVAIELKKAAMMLPE